MGISAIFWRFCGSLLDFMVIHDDLMGMFGDLSWKFVGFFNGDSMVVLWTCVAFYDDVQGFMVILVLHICQQIWYLFLGISGLVSVKIRTKPHV